MPESTANPPRLPADEPPAGDQAISRRNFLLVILGVTGSLGVFGIAAPILRYLYPVVRAEAAPRIEVGKLDALEPLGEALYFDYQEVPAALIKLEDGTPKAFYLVCTHFGCITTWEVEEKIFWCPCHAGKFAPDGTVVGGPPPKPLQELKVVDEGGTLFVEGTVT